MAAPTDHGLAAGSWKAGPQIRLLPVGITRFAIPISPAPRFLSFIAKPRSRGAYQADFKENESHSPYRHVLALIPPGFSSMALGHRAPADRYEDQIISNDIRTHGYIRNGHSCPDNGSHGLVLSFRLQRTCHCHWARGERSGRIPHEERCNYLYVSQPLVGTTCCDIYLRKCSLNIT